MSNGERLLLQERYGWVRSAALARQLGRTVENVEAAALRLFPPSRARDTAPWSAEDTRVLCGMLGNVHVRRIAAVLERSVASVRARIEGRRTQLKRGPWTYEERRRLKRLYGSRTTGDLCAILSRSPAAIEAYASAMYLRKDKHFTKTRGGRSSMPRWTEDEVELLIADYADVSNASLARALQRSEKSIVAKAAQLGLRKSEKRLKRMGRENVNRRHQRGH